MQEMKIHRVAAGPISPNEALAYADIPEEYSSYSFVEVLFEDEDGDYPLPGTLFFDSFDTAYRFCFYLATNIGPVVARDDNCFYDTDGNELDFKTPINTSWDN